MQKYVVAKVPALFSFFHVNTNIFNNDISKMDQVFTVILYGWKIWRKLNLADCSKRQCETNLEDFDLMVFSIDEPACVMSRSATYNAHVRTSLLCIGHFCVVNFVLHLWLPHSFWQTTHVQMGTEERFGHVPWQ